MEKTEFERRYNQKSENFEKIKTAVFGLIKNRLLEEKIPYLQIQSRVKECDSAFNKIERKKYENPFQEITDFVGLRVITYLESDIKKIEGLIESLFEIDDTNSVNKLQPAEIHSVGYRSLHKICLLGNERKKLPEYRSIYNIRFELQVRTLLQHSWAEIEHKYNYKSEFALPKDLQRRLMLLAGQMESADNEFSRISSEATKYANRLLGEESKSDQLSVLSLVTLVEAHAKEYGLELSEKSKSEDFLDLALKDISKYGISSVAEFHDLLSTENLKKANEMLYSAGKKVSLLSLVRVAMAVDDVDMFFSSGAAGSITRIAKQIFDCLNTLTGGKFAKYVSERGIPIVEKT